MNDTPTRDPLAVYALARARAGAADYDAALILDTWPDAPLGNGKAGDLLTWLETRPPLAELVAQTDPETPPQPDGWQIYSLRDAYQPRPPVEYVVGGLLPLPSLTIVYAPPGCFKTMLLADLTASVASGQPWLDPLPGKAGNTQRATIQKPALWCDFDNGPRTMHERIEAVGRARNLSEDTPLHYVSMPNPWLDASYYGNVEMLGEIIKRLGAGLVVIDNLRDVSGNVDENSAEMGNVMSNFRRLVEDTEAAVILIHHQRKSSGIGGGRAGDTLRGHSSIEAALDLALLVEREEHAEQVTIKATKARGADIYPFGAVFTYDHKPGTQELAKVRFYGVEVEDLSSDAAIRRTILELAKNNPGENKGSLTNATKALLADVGINRIGSLVDLLASEGRLVVKDGAKNAKLYYLPSGQVTVEVV